MSAGNELWPSERPSGMPNIVSLEVMCAKDHMDVHMTFSHPFEGIVSSKGDSRADTSLINALLTQFFISLKSLYRSTQRSSMHLRATVNGKDILLIPHLILALRYETWLEWTILRKHGKIKRRQLINNNYLWVGYLYLYALLSIWVCAPIFLTYPVQQCL